MLADLGNTKELVVWTKISGAASQMAINKNRRCSPIFAGAVTTRYR